MAAPPVPTSHRSLGLSGQMSARDSVVGTGTGLMPAPFHRSRVALSPQNQASFGPVAATPQRFLVVPPSNWLQLPPSQWTIAPALPTAQPSPALVIQMS